MSDAIQADRGDAVEVRLTGRPHARIEGSWHRLPMDLGTAILFYLAVRRVWCERAQLASLFWPDDPHADASRRLRQHVQRLKALRWATSLEVESERMRWAPATDLDAFERTVAANDIATAIEHYRGPLLEGMPVNRVGEFSEWLRAERWARHDRWRQAAFRMVDEHLTQNVGRTDAELMAEVRCHDPFDEAALRREMQVLEALGQREAALRAFARYRTWLAQEAGSMPEDPTRHLASRLREERPHHDRSPRAPVARMSRATPSRFPPLFAAPLVGRGRLLAEVSARLSDVGGPRLLTLWGPGGVGKTHLAVHAMRAWVGPAGRPPLFVPLEHAANQDDAFRAIADELQQPDPSPASVGQALTRRTGLAVLDNVEQIEGVADALARLLREAPGLRLLVTSRRLIGDALGAVVEVEPLAVRVDGAIGTGERHMSVPAGEDRHGEELFVLYARRRFPGIDAVLEENAVARAAVRRIVVHAGGLPLALVLAAGWTGTLTLPEIADQLERGIGVLRSASSDLPARHRSIEATLEVSWSLVPDGDRDRLAAVAVFQEGFDRSAAEAVVGVDTARLREWVDRAWLQRQGSRYAFHPLARRFLEDRISPDDRIQVERRHAHHYAALVEAAGAELIGPDAPEALHRLLADRGNIRAAWRRSVRSGWAEHVSRAAHGLYEFLDIARAHPERIELLQLAAEAWEEFATRPGAGRRVRRRCRIMLLTSADACDSLLGDMHGDEDDGFLELDRALALSRASRVDPDLVGARRRWEEAAAVYRRLGRRGLEGSAALRFAERLEVEQRFPELVTTLERAEALFDMAGSHDHALVARVRRARALGAMGEEQAMRAELAACRPAIRETHPSVCRYLRVEWLGSHLALALGNGRSVRSRRLLAKYIRAREAIGAGHGDAVAAIARIAEIERNWDTALASWRVAVQTEEIDRKAALLGVARTRLAIGHEGAAAVALREARHEASPEDPWMLVELARWLAVMGGSAAASRVVGAVARHAEELRIAQLERRAKALAHEFGLGPLRDEDADTEPDSLSSAAALAWRRFDEVGG